MDRTEETIFQDLCWPGIRNSIGKEVTNCNTYQNTKRSNIKYGKLPSKEDEEIPQNKLCVYLICPYVKRINGKTDNLYLNGVTMIYPVIGWFKIMQYDDKISISIANLVENTCLTGYPIP